MGDAQYPNSYWPYPAQPVYPQAFLNDQKRGEALPYYLNWHQLRAIRDRSRLLCSTNEYAISAITNLQSFIVGSGFTYRALPAHDDKEGNDELISQVQRVIDIFVGANRLDQIEAETVQRDAVDGETFLRLFYDESGLVRVRFIEPEHVYPGEGDGDPAHSFGVETDPDDICNIRGYDVVENPLTTGWTTKFVSGRKVIHSKRNVTSGAKRGLPLLYPVEANLRRAEELLAAMSVTTKTRAKVAMIRRIEGASKTAAQRLKTEAETGTTITAGGLTTNVEEYPLGTILTASKNLEYEFPQHNAGSETGIQVLQAELRAVAARLVMPEMMLSADASGATYSSQLVAEAPSTRNFERLQRYYRSLFGESRAPRHESLIWRQIAHAVNTGLIPREALTDVKIIAQGPAIIPRDPDKAATANKTYLDMKAKSPQQICAEIGGDWNVTQREFKAAGYPDGPMGGAPMTGGMPGAAPMPGAEGEMPPGDDGGGEGAGEDFTFADVDFSDL